MFNRIARRYDCLNGILSLGIHRRWRKRLSQRVSVEDCKVALDLATGSGDQVLDLLKRIPGLTRVVGLDRAIKMLEVAVPKLHDPRCALTLADAKEIPVRDNSIDAVTMSFGIRNVPQPVEVLTEAHRVLRPKGACGILEFGMPTNPLVRMGYLFYLRLIVPFIGGIISGDRAAYKYLNTSVEEFPRGEEFAALMKSAGFTEVAIEPLTFGIAYVYIGTK